MEDGHSEAQGARQGAAGELRQLRRPLLDREEVVFLGVVKGVAGARGQEQLGAGRLLRAALPLQPLLRETATPGAVARQRATGTRTSERVAPASSLRVQAAEPQKYDFANRTILPRLSRSDEQLPLQIEWARGGDQDRRPAALRATRPPGGRASPPGRRSSPSRR